MLGEGHDAVLSAKSAITVYHELQDKKGEAKAQQMLAEVHLARGRPDEALSAATSMVEIFSQLGDKKAQAHAQQMIANIYMQGGDPPAAIRTGKEAAELFSKTGEKSGEATAWHTVAQAHMVIYSSAAERCETEADYAYLPVGDAKEAAQYAKKARLLFRQENDDTSELAVLHTIAQAHWATQNIREAIRAGEEESQMAKRVKEPAAEAQALLLLSGLYAEMGRHAPAYRSAAEAKDVFEKIGDQECAYNAQNQMEALGPPRGGYGEHGVQPFGRASLERDPANRRERGGAFEEESKTLFKRKAFPWTQAQRQEVANQGA